MKIELEYNIEEPERIPPSLIKDLEIEYSSIKDIYLNSNINKKYNNYLKGKNVILVGPSSYLENKNRGEWFDTFDVVVRLNRSYPVINTKSYGSKCDIRYHNMCQNLAQGGPFLVDQMEKDNVSFISTHFPKHLSYFHNDIKTCENELKNSKVQFHHWADLEQYLTLQMILQTRLNLINYDFNSLHISGITFFNDGYVSDYKNRDEDLIPIYNSQKVKNHPNIDKAFNHAQKPQKQLMELIFNNDSRITLDDEVKNSLYL